MPMNLFKNTHLSQFLSAQIQKSQRTNNEIEKSRPKPHRPCCKVKVYFCSWKNVHKIKIRTEKEDKKEIF